MRERAQAGARRAIAVLEKLPLAGFRGTWTSLLLLLLWLSFAGQVWEWVAAIAAEPGGARALFLFLGTLWFISMLMRAPPWSGCGGSRNRSTACD
ncbi:MAG: hypothetical protein LKG20_09395 [Tetrasphaera jenkinsii]|jgi:hypothetical protein|nr:hypothetical protein [Tetrasphaera jenkinsii]